MKELVSSDLKKGLKSKWVSHYQLLIHWWPILFCIIINLVTVDRKSHTQMPASIYLNSSAMLDCSMNEKLVCFKALAACGDLQEKWNALLARETIELKPVRRSKLRGSLSKLKAVSSSSKQGKKWEYTILLQGDFMRRLQQEKKKGKVQI